MKTKIITLIVLLLSAAGMYAQEHKILVAYFSWSGNTQHVAEYRVSRKTVGIFQIKD